MMGVGSYMQSHNRIQILSMNEAIGMRKELEIDEPWPATKIMWLPPSEGLISSERDIFATSSDILRIYTIDRDRAVDGNVNGYKFYQAGEPIKLQNNSEFNHPIMSFDWNQTDNNTIATASIDSSVTIWDLEKYQISTQLIAHDKAVHDISFSKESTKFATVGEDGSVRLFDIRDLRNSTIIHEDR